MQSDTSRFTDPLIAWQKRAGRHDLPWQQSRDPYRVWLSEIMLQQTQVGSVIGYYDRFLTRFPTLADLAAAPLDAVLALWSGLGYYSRARNLHRAAQMIVEQHGGVFPRDITAIEALPGIGRSTAAAIAAFSFGQRRAILDGNVKRVLARFFCIEGPTNERATENQLWSLAETLLPEGDIEAYTQGLMDLGAEICRPANPSCMDCPLRVDCQARAAGRERELPQKKRRVPVPERAVRALLLCAGNRVYLEKRPDTGIWGGLYSLPEIASDADPAQWCRQQFGVEPIGLQGLPAFTHTFTHFKLLIEPWRLEMPAGLPGDWRPLEEALAAGIPTPVRRLLNQMRRPPDVD